MCYFYKRLGLLNSEDTNTLLGTVPRLKLSVKCKKLYCLKLHVYVIFMGYFVVCSDFSALIVDMGV